MPDTARSAGPIAASYAANDGDILALDDMKLSDGADVHSYGDRAALSMPARVYVHHLVYLPLPQLS